MPNYVVNVLKAVGADERRMAQINAFVRSENEINGKKVKVVFDFMKIIPMPEDLNVVEGSDIQSSVALYKRYCRPEIRYDAILGVDKDTFEKIRMTEEEELMICGRMLPPLEYGTDFSRDREALNTPAHLYESPDDVFGVKAPRLVAGHRYTMNQLHYGHQTWYGWCREHWGTKWNSCDSKKLEDGSGWRYETAWSCSEPVVRALSVIFPEVRFELWYADEDYGTHSGIVCYVGGDKVDEQTPATQKDGVEFSVKLWEGEDKTPEEVGFVWDESSGRYKFNEEVV